jgi:phospholipid-transporting ATPase
VETHSSFVSRLKSLSRQLLFTLSLCVFWGDLKLPDGTDTGLWFWGTTLYLMVLLTVLGKAALISE